MIYAIYTSGKAIIILVILPFVCLLPDLFYQYVMTVFYPTPSDKVRRSQRHGITPYVPPIVEPVHHSHDEDDATHHKTKRKASRRNTSFIHRRKSRRSRGSIKDPQEASNDAEKHHHKKHKKHSKVPEPEAEDLSEIRKLEEFKSSNRAALELTPHTFK